jgi:hypothetical protein
MRSLRLHGFLSRLAVLATAPALVAIVVALLATPGASSAPTADAAPPLRDAAIDVQLDAHLDGAAADARPDAPKIPDARFVDVRSIPPDPTPLLSDAAFVLTVRFDKGTVSIEKTKRIVFPKKEALARHMGRFAAELYVGPTLIERLRFDFPLIADDDNAGESYAKGLNVAVEVKIPDSDRPTRLEIWDRATDKRWSFPYPPKLTP